MLGDSAKLQLLKNATEERDLMKEQAAIVVPKGEMRKRAQLPYLIAKVNQKDLIFIYSSNHYSVFFRLNMMIFN